MAEMFCARFSLVTLTFYLILSRTRGEVFTALIDLENLVYRERELRFTLEEYVNLEEQRLAKLKKFLSKVNAAHNVVGDDVSRYLGHPVNSYLEIRRMYKEWPEAERLVQLDNSEGKCPFFREICLHFIGVMNSITTRFNVSHRLISLSFKIGEQLCLP